MKSEDSKRNPPEDWEDSYRKADVGIEATNSEKIYFKSDLTSTHLFSPHYDPKDMCLTEWPDSESENVIDPGEEIVSMGMSVCRRL